MFERLHLTLQVLRGDVAARFEREEGATAVEYGLMVALIAVPSSLPLGSVDDGLNGIFGQVSDELSGVAVT